MFIVQPGVWGPSRPNQDAVKKAAGGGGVWGGGEDERMRTDHKDPGQGRSRAPTSWEAAFPLFRMMFVF